MPCIFFVGDPIMFIMLEVCVRVRVHSYTKIVPFGLSLLTLLYASACVCARAVL